MGGVEKRENITKTYSMKKMILIIKRKKQFSEDDKDLTFARIYLKSQRE